MLKIAVIGDRESVCGFASVGFDVFYVTDKDDGSKKIKELASDNYAVIFITELLAKELGEDIDKYKDSITPAIILIPGVSGNTGEGLSSVLRSVERAVGSQLIE